MLSSHYPNYDWLPWKFEERLPVGFWNDIKNQLNFMDWVATELQYKEKEDWYKLSSEVNISS